MSDNLIIEFRRELMRGLSKMDSDTFLTRKEVKNFIDESYGKAKDRANAEEDIIEDVE